MEEFYIFYSFYCIFPEIVSKLVGVAPHRCSQRQEKGASNRKLGKVGCCFSAQTGEKNTTRTEKNIGLKVGQVDILSALILRPNYFTLTRALIS